MNVGFTHVLLAKANREWVCPTGGTEHSPVFQPSWFHETNGSDGFSLEEDKPKYFAWNVYTPYTQFKAHFFKKDNRKKNCEAASVVLIQSGSDTGPTQTRKPCLPSIPLFPFNRWLRVRVFTAKEMLWQHSMFEFLNAAVINHYCCCWMRALLENTNRVFTRFPFRHFSQFSSYVFITKYL